jgi:hypothetical protein
MITFVVVMEIHAGYLNADDEAYQANFILSLPPTTALTVPHEQRESPNIPPLNLTDADLFSRLVHLISSNIR